MYRRIELTAGCLHTGRHIRVQMYTANAATVLADFISEMERVLSVYGLVGYRENWTYEFPISLFLKLKDSSKDINTLSYGTLSAEDNVGSEVQVTDFTSERELLKLI